MICYDDALALLTAIENPNSSESILLENARGRILAEDLRARVASPPFTNSAMDGFALSASDCPENELTVCQSVFAGAQGQELAKPPKNHCVQIMTGAPLPQWADAVIPVEDTKLISSSAILVTKLPKAGANIRRQGEDIAEGKIFLRKGECLTPSRLMAARQLGCEAVPVYKRPRVGLFATGDELTTPGGGQLKRGMIYNSNSVFLKAALADNQINLSEDTVLRDDIDAARRALARFLETDEPSLMITTGAVSAGEKDFIPVLARGLKFQKIFHKVGVRPGKPVFLARRGTSLWLGVPGNPISAFTCYYYFLRPLLAAWAGIPAPVKEEVTLAEDRNKPEGFHCFFRGKKEGHLVRLADSQGSAHFSPLLSADLLVELPAGTGTVQKGTLLQAIRIGD